MAEEPKVCEDFLDAYITLEKEIRRNKFGTLFCAEPDYYPTVSKNADKRQGKVMDIEKHSLRIREPKTVFHSDSNHDITKEFIRNVTECQYEKDFFKKKEFEFRRDFPKEVKEKLTTGFDYLPPISITYESVMYTTEENNRIASYDCVLVTNVIDNHLIEINFLVAKYIAYCVFKKASREVAVQGVSRLFEESFKRRMGILCDLLDYLKDDGYLILDNLSYQLLILGCKYFSVDAESFEDSFNKRSVLLPLNKRGKCPLIEIEVINAIGKPARTSYFWPAEYVCYFHGVGASNLISVIRKDSNGFAMKYPSLALVAIKKYGEVY